MIDLTGQVAIVTSVDNFVRVIPSPSDAPLVGSISNKRGFC